MAGTMMHHAPISVSVIARKPVQRRINPKAISSADRIDSGV